MNVTCPACHTIYRVDPAKVPPDGALAQCARCPGTFEVAGSDTGNSAKPSVDDSAIPSGDGESSALVGESTTSAPTDVAVSGPVVTYGGDPAQAPPAEPPFPEPSDGREGWGESSPDIGDEAAVPSYSGASDVAFHTEETPPDDLPYLESQAPSNAHESEVPSPGGDPAPAGLAQTPGPDDAASSAVESPTPEPDALSSSTAAGEAPLPPAPFGARSDPHRRAARLARALVSDIVVYHPERRTRSLRQGTLRQEFRDEIRKSWEEYANQVGGDFARQTTYFRDALNEILAEGAAVF